MQQYNSRNLWEWYLLGAILTLVYKWTQYIYIGRSKGKSIKSCTLEWFFEASVSNGASWATTIGLVWAIGVSYIDRLGWLFSSALNNIPLVPAFAFLLGSLAEFLAPNWVKWLFKFLHIDTDGDDK